MVNLQGLINRCKEIIQEGKDAIKNEDKLKMMKCVASIENIFRVIYPNHVPAHLRLSHIEKSLRFFGIGAVQNPAYTFSLYLPMFEGFTEDLEKGLLIQNLSNLISLDLYSDLLQQAQELRKSETEPLNRAACVLTRIVLEDTLKKICDIHKIVPATPKADQYNIALRTGNVYGEALKKQVDAWLGIGNTAAHPENVKTKFSDISTTQMDDMIKQIKEFSDKFLI